MLLVDLSPSRKIRSISRDDLMVVGRMSVRRIYALRTARPLRRRAARTRRPPLVAMRARKPWVLLRLRLFGWYVRFTIPPISSLVLRAKPDDYMGALEHCQRRRACRLNELGFASSLADRTADARAARNPFPLVKKQAPCGPSNSFRNLWILWKTQDVRL